SRRAEVGTPASRVSSAGLAPRMAPTRRVASSATERTGAREPRVTATWWVGMTSTEVHELPPILGVEDGDDEIALAAREHGDAVAVGLGLHRLQAKPVQLGEPLDELAVEAG